MLRFHYRYEDALVSLMSEILHKMQFRYNQSQLEEMDDDALDDDVRTLLGGRWPLEVNFTIFDQD